MLRIFVPTKKSRLKKPWQWVCIHYRSMALALRFLEIHPVLVLPPTSFTPCYFNVPYQLRELLNLRCLILCLTPLGWLHFITPAPYFLWEYLFWFTPTFWGTQLWRKAMHVCILWFLPRYCVIRPPHSQYQHNTKMIPVSFKSHGFIQ
jgi:hypothetical protein